MIHRLAGLLIAFFVLSALFWVLQRLWPSVRGQRAFRRGFLTDCIYWVWTAVGTRAMTFAAVAAALLPLALLWGTNLRGLVHGHGVLGAQPLWLQAMEIFVIGDFLGYWQHRAFHRAPLWRFHAIHHSSRELDWLSSVRLHPVNDALARIVEAVPLVVLGYDTTAVALYAPLATFYAIFVHANLGWDYGPLRYVVVSPAFHRWHHTDAEEGLDKNFAGALPLWDILFGTFHMPQGRRSQTFGVKDPVPDGFFGQMIYPFR